MANLLTPGLQAVSAKRIKKVRDLPVEGELLVNVGDVVESNTIIGRAYLPGELVIARLPEQMGLQVFEVLQGLRVKEGDFVSTKQLICEHSGLFGLFHTRYFAPCSGQIELISQQTGHLGIRMQAVPIEKNAYISGKIIDLEPKKQVTIEAEATFIQGIFGLGGEKTGKLKCIAKPEQKIEHQHIPEDCTGLVLFGGYSPSIAAMQKALESGAVGLITASLIDSVIKDFLGYDLGLALTGDENVTMTVIMTEGFGEIPFSAKAYNLLVESEGLLASINGATQVRAGAVRPEVIVPRDGLKFDQTNEQEQSLKIGTKIRIIRVPFFGFKGQITELPQELRKIETGALTRVLAVHLEDGREVLIPRANVEISY